MAHTCTLSTLGDWGRRLPNLSPPRQFSNLLRTCRKIKSKKDWGCSSGWRPWVQSPVSTTKQTKPQQNLHSIDRAWVLPHCIGLEKYNITEERVSWFLKILPLVEYLREGSSPFPYTPCYSPSLWMSFGCPRIRFWHCLPGVSVVSHRPRAQSCSTAPVSSPSCDLCFEVTSCKSGFLWAPSLLFIIC